MKFMKPVGETPGQIRDTITVALVASMVALASALVASVPGGVLGIYLYDRGMSKGNDIAVGMIGALAAGTFVFVTVFAWLNNKHHKIGWRTPAIALIPCFALAAALTWLERMDPDYPYYSDFVFAGWVVILVCGLLAVYVCSRFATRRSG